MDSGIAWAAERSAQRGKPAGGFVFLRARDLCRVWQAYREGLIRFRDVRVWLAAQELVARRCECGAGELLRYTLHELRGLVGGTSPKASIKRLSRLELLSWSDASITVPKGPESQETALNGLPAMLAEVANNRRLVPVPRRTVRLLAQTGRPAVVATILGHLLRCVYYRGGQVVSWGTCKASWVADTFGVDIRNVKRARKHLLSIHWLEERESPRWHRQRWGGSYVVNLAWSRPASYADCPPPAETETPPPPAAKSPELPPLGTNRELPSGHKNQKPATGGRSGVLQRESKKDPSWKHVEPEDLKDTRRLLVLFDLAIAAGELKGSEHERLMLVTAAEHALVRGLRNPCGLFVHLVKGKLWHYCTNDDEDAARRRINQHLHPESRVMAEKPKNPPKIELSDDARLAQAVVTVANQRRLDGFFLVRQMRPEWTRDRFNRAVSELEDARLRRCSHFVRSHPAD